MGNKKDINLLPEEYRSVSPKVIARKKEGVKKKVYYIKM